MDVTFTIPTPILVTWQSFDVRIRELPAGSFGAPTNTTTQQVTFAGLDPVKDYQIEVVFNNGTEDCPPAYYTVYLKTAEPCWEFTPEFMYSNGVWFLRINWVGTTLPDCGYIFSWRQGTNAGSVIYNGGGVPLDIIVPNGNPVTLIIYADDCDSLRTCYNDVVTYGEPCIPLIIGEKTIGQTSPASGVWNITLYLTNSNPLTITSPLTYVQTGVVAGFTPASNSSVVTISPVLSFSVTVAAGSFTGLTPTFSGNLVDYCGNVIPFTI